MRVDSDDMLMPDAVYRMLEQAKLDNSQGVITGYYQTDDATLVRLHVDENRWHPACCLLSKWAVNELKYREDLHYFEGLEFFSRFRKQYQVDFIKDALWIYRQHDAQKSNSKNRDAREKVKAELKTNFNHGSITSI